MTPKPVATVILTRPEAQSRALAAALGAVAGEDLRFILSPVLEIACVGDPPELTGFAGIILTSANAVPCSPNLTGRRVHCVGARTAEAARAARAEVASVAMDADRLVAEITARGAGTGPLVHLRGDHARGAVAERLTAAGIETAECVIYTQKAVPLTAAARDAIEGDAPVILPLFSPRSAQLVGDSLHPGPALHTIALSEAVAEAWRAATGASAETCDQPSREAMSERIVAALRRKLP